MFDDSNKGQEAGDVSEHLEMKDYKEKLLSVHHTYSAELLIPSGSADIKTGSDHADEEVWEIFLLLIFSFTCVLLRYFISEC